MAEILVRYVGKKAKYRDHLYGSGTEWTPGQVQPVLDKFAVKLMNHPEFQDARHKSQVGKPIAVEPEPPKKEEEPDVPLVHLDSMTKEAIIQFGHRHFNLDLQPTLRKGDMIAKVRAVMGGAPKHIV